MSITERQRIQRQKFIGSSDMPAVMGVDPYRSAADIFWAKSGRMSLTEEEISDPAQAGNYLESSILQWGSDQLGVKIRRNQRRVKGVFAANLDAIVVGRPEALEAKTSGLYNPFFEADDWGDMGTSDVPARVLIQAHHQMYAADLERVWVPALISGKGLMLYRLERQEDLIEEMVEVGEKFWECVQNGTPPENSTPGFETLKKLFREPHVEAEVDDELFQNFVELKAAAAAAKKAADEAQKALIASLETAERGVCSFGSLTYLEQTQKRVDTQKLRQLHPEIAEELSKEVTFRVLRTKEF